MRKWLKLTAVLVPGLVALLAAFFQYVLPSIIGSKPPPPPQPTTFAGVVADERTGKVVQNAKVTLEAKGVSPVTYTDSEGAFSFPLSPDVHEIKIRVDKEGYNRFDRRINVSAKNELEDIRLKPLDSFLPSPTITPNPTENKSPPIQKSQRTPKPKAPDLEERKRRAREYLNSNS